MITRCCAECGLELLDLKARGPKRKRFCSKACANAANTRKITRGMVLVKLFAAYRFDRKRAADRGVMNAMCRLMARWHDEDIRHGREPMETGWAAILAEDPTLTMEWAGDRPPYSAGRVAHHKAA